MARSESPSRTNQQGDVELQISPLGVATVVHAGSESEYHNGSHTSPPGGMEAAYIFPVLSRLTNVLIVATTSSADLLTVRTQHTHSQDESY